MSAYDEESTAHARAADDGFDEDRLAEELLTQELLAACEPEPPRMHDGIPIRGYRGGEPIPDLGRVPQERWREVLAPLRPGTRGSSRQLNFRLGPDEHARLLQAARLFGMRPTTLARILTVRGVDRALYEERRAR